jgi:hypothetical protein
VCAHLAAGMARRVQGNGAGLALVFVVEIDHMHQKFAQLEHPVGQGHCLGMQFGVSGKQVRVVAAHHAAA